MLCAPPTQVAVAAQPTVPAHLPAAHKSLPVQPLLSSQATVLFVNTHPCTASQLSLVQPLPSLQGMAGPATHAPRLHWSPPVHTLPSLQAALLLLWLQPVMGVQMSSVHTLPSSQLST